MKSPREELRNAMLYACLRAADYRDFLRQAYSIRNAANPSFNYAELSRRAGYESRSFARQLILGKKRVTLSSLPRIIRAFELPAEAAKYFTLLVALEETEVNLRGLSQEGLRSELEAQRARLMRANRGPARQVSASVSRFSEWRFVYASLGGRERGATLSEIITRSGLPAASCRRILEEMTAQKLILLDAATRRYRSEEPHLVFSKLAETDSFKDYFLKTSTEVTQQAKEHFASGERLFFSSTISVRKELLPELKQRLREVLTEFAETAETPEGNGLATISAGMFPR